MKINISTRGLMIGRGNTAEIYDLGDGTVIKRFVQHYPKESALNEYRNAQIMQAKGLPVPKCFEFVEEDGHFGIIYEKVDGIDLFEHMIHTGLIEQDIQIFSNYHQKILDCKDASLPSYKEFIQAVLNHKFQDILKLLDHLPDGDTLCHGDYHPLNVLITADDDFKIIDFMNVCRGPKLYDIARTYYLLSSFNSEDIPREEIKQIA